MRASTVLAVFAAAVLAPWAVLAEGPAIPAETILLFENLSAADAPAVLSSTDRLVWDRLTGRALAQAPAGAASRLEHIPHSVLKGVAGQDFGTALRAELPAYVPGVRGESRYAIKEAVALVKPQGAPRQRPEGRESFVGSTCLSESFEVLPIWYEDGGPWWHYEGGQPYNNVGNYFWLDDDCDAVTGGWEAGAIMGGDMGQSLPCGATYDYNTDSWMEYAPWITCAAGAPDAALSFYTRLQTEEGYDLFYYLVTVDGTNYLGYSLSGNYADTWYAVTQDMRSWYGLGDLTAYPQFALAFAFQSDDQVNQGFGVKVDDIALVIAPATCPTITLSPETLSGGVVGTPYSQTVTAVGGTAPYTFTKTGGTLPAGLALASDGVLAGIPTAAGTFDFTVTATDAEACTGSTAYSVTTGSSICPTITLSASTLPKGTMGTAYSQAITAAGGTAPYTFTKTGGTLPAGLSLTTGGVLAGIPTAAGTFNFTVTAADAQACTGAAAVSITILTATCPTITLTPTAMPSGTVGTGYYLVLGAAGGTGPYTFAKTSGTRPTGLNLSSNGVLSGVPTASGTFDFTVTATDAHGCTGAQSYSVSINNMTCPTITLSPASLPGGTIGVGYYRALSAAGGTGPYIYAKTSGTRPTGLALASDGVLSGVPTAAGTFSFTVTATDSKGCTGSQNYTITIATIPPPTVSSMVKMGNPFRIVVNGNNLQSGVKVFIDANRWTKVVWKSKAKVVITGGLNLKAAVPQGTPKDFTFLNPDGGSTTVTGWSW